MQFDAFLTCWKPWTEPPASGQHFGTPASMCPYSQGQVVGRIWWFCLAPREWNQHPGLCCSRQSQWMILFASCGHAALMDNMPCHIYPSDGFPGTLGDAYHTVMGNGQCVQPSCCCDCSSWQIHCTKQKPKGMSNTHQRGKYMCGLSLHFQTTSSSHTL